MYELRPHPRLDLAPPAERGVTLMDPFDDCGWTDVSNAVLDDPRLSNDAKLVYVVLRSLGSCGWRKPATVDRVRLFLRWGTKRVRKALDNLQEVELLSVETD